jgi:hypothetical protein
LKGTAQEGLHTIKLKKIPALAMKIDLAKAYDKVGFTLDCCRFPDLELYFLAQQSLFSILLKVGAWEANSRALGFRLFAHLSRDFSAL